MSVNSRKISVVIPAYNKDQVLFTTCQNILTQLELATSNFEVIVVNDGSTDNTLEKALEFKKFNGSTDKLKVYNLGQNSGKGAALCAGFMKTVGDIVIFADGDLDFPAKNLRVALAYFDQTEADIAVGSKRHPLSIVSYPLIRRILSFGYQVLIRFLFNLNVSDTQVGLKVFKREVLEKVVPKIVVKAAAFDLELLVVAKTYGFSKICEFPIEFRSEISPKMNWETVKDILSETMVIFWQKAILGAYWEKPAKHLPQLFLTAQKS